MRAHTRMKCAAITWARCTRVASVRASAGSLHRSDRDRRMCVCTRLSRRRAAQVRAFARGKSAIGLADLSRSQGIQ
jgi:hypothetical protein